MTPRPGSTYLSESTVHITRPASEIAAVPAAELRPAELRHQSVERSPHHSSDALTANSTRLAVFSASVFLVAVPVFFQAPLVQLLPWLSLGMTLLWVGVGRSLLDKPATRVWGDLLIGFAWTWLAGSVYWGWLRWEPIYHLPVEALGLPFVLPGLSKAKHKIGHWFYLGSLLGTAITDLYFYLLDLIPYWRQLMRADVSAAGDILQTALHQIYTPLGGGAALLLVGLLVVVGFTPLRSPHLHWWSFGGAVLSAILVDGLFWLAATLA